MKRKTHQLILGSILLFTLVACTAGGTSQNVVQENQNAAPEEQAAPDTSEEDQPILYLVLGDVSDEPAKKIKRFQPLAEYLAANLSEYGYAVGEVRIAPDLETMAAWMVAGEVDLYFDSLYPAMVVSEQSGAAPILRRWKSGNEQYHTVLFALAESGISSVEDLVGEMIAFEDPNSTSGYLLPLSYLMEAGLNPVEKSTTESLVSGGEVGYVFSHEDQNTLQWVVSSVVAVGATDDGNYAELLEETDAELVVIAETESVARQVAMVRPGMDPEILEAITILLLGLDEHPEGQAVLEAFKTTQFDEFPEGAEQAFERMRELFSLVSGE